MKKLARSAVHYRRVSNKYGLLQNLISGAKYSRRNDTSSDSIEEAQAWLIELGERVSKAEQAYEELGGDVDALIYHDVVQEED